MHRRGPYLPPKERVIDTETLNRPNRASGPTCPDEDNRLLIKLFSRITLKPEEVYVWVNRVYGVRIIVSETYYESKNRVVGTEP